MYAQQWEVIVITCESGSRISICTCSVLPSVHACVFNVTWNQTAV